MKRALSVGLFWAATVSTSHSDVKPESPLSKLPFEIKLGKTTNKELSARGVCTKEIKVSEAYLRCASYSMLGGKFTVFSNQNETAQSIEFRDSNILPQPWKDLGLKLAPDFLGAHGDGSSIKELVKIAKDQGALDVTQRIENKPGANCQSTLWGHVSFRLRDVQYDAKFYAVEARPVAEEVPYYCVQKGGTVKAKAKDVGLYELKLTEAY